MPIPKPRKNEKQDDFIKRCMSNDVMVQEYTDRSQRYAICMDSWRRAKKMLEYHEFLHSEYEKTGNVSIIKEHAEIVDSLRNLGQSMVQNDMLDEYSMKYEKTVKALMPTDIPNLLEPGGQTIFQQFIGKIKEIDIKMPKIELDDEELFIQLKNIETSKHDNIISSFVSIQEPADGDDYLTIVVRAQERQEHLEKKILKIFPVKLRPFLKFEYNIKGPDKSYIPLFNLTLKPLNMEYIKVSKYIQM